MAPWKILSVALLSAFLVSGCARQQDDEVAAGTDAGGETAVAESERASVGVGDVQPGSQEDLVVAVGDRIFFDFDRSEVRSDQEGSLDRLAVWLARNGGVDLQIGGHADERGTTEYNLALGERRANAVREYLVAAGVETSRLRTVSFGEERPAAVGSNEEAWAQNRRAQFHVR